MLFVLCYVDVLLGFNQRVSCVNAYYSVYYEFDHDILLKITLLMFYGLGCKLCSSGVLIFSLIQFYVDVKLDSNRM